MTPIDLDAVSAAAVSWLLTYAIHSTILLGAALAIAMRFADEHAWLDLVWKTAMIGPLVTASVQVGADLRPLGGRWPVATAVPMADAAPERQAEPTFRSTNVAAPEPKSGATYDKVASPELKFGPTYDKAAPAGLKLAPTGRGSAARHRRGRCSPWPRGWRLARSAWRDSARGSFVSIAPFVRGPRCRRRICARWSTR